MQELIKITQTKIDGGSINSVNARELHKLLEIKKDFSDWIKQQIGRLNLVENKNYLRLPLKGETKIDYRTKAHLKPIWKYLKVTA